MQVYPKRSSKMSDSRTLRIAQPTIGHGVSLTVEMIAPGSARACPLQLHVLCLAMAKFRTTGCAGRRKTTQAIGIRNAGRSAWLALLFAATIATQAAAETPVRFTLDFKLEGPSAPFLVPLDKGYYTAEGLNVTIDPALGSLQPIERVASGEYDMGFGDINTLIKFRDAKPASPVKAVFMVYNRPPYAVIGRKSRGIVKPKDLEGKTLGAPSAGGAFAQWPIFAQVNSIDVTKVAIENVSFPVREPMLAAGQVDAITGYSFTSYVDLKDKGVPVDDIVVLLMADYGVVLYGNAILVNTKFAAEHPDA